MPLNDIADPRKAAWINSFFDENHLSYPTSPELVASPAQMKFMVRLEEGERYYPCTKEVYDQIMLRSKSPVLREMYNQAWSRISKVVEAKLEDQSHRDFLIELLNIKYEHETANYNIIPSRLEKRLFKLFVVTTQIEDPLRDEKDEANKRAESILRDPAFIRAINRPAGEYAPAKCFREESLESARRHLDATKLKRMFQISIQEKLWADGAAHPSEDDLARIFEQPISGGGWEQLETFLLTPRDDLAGHWKPRRILYLADKAGQIVFDLAVIKMLISLGHKVLLTVKNAAYYDYVYLGDIVGDPDYKKWMPDAEIVTSPNLTKNQLAALLRNGKSMCVISDGNMENVNLLRSSITFARAFKEVDGIISKGIAQRRRLFLTPFEFSQDIYSFTPNPDGSLGVLYKPRCPRTVRFSTQTLEEMAGEIIGKMRQAKTEGSTVMFYSGIVGSIPGETETAIKVMTVFINDLKTQQEGAFIINPSSFFEPGMDADDLMYMWEIVQRNGPIDIWRFQTFMDIERSFALLGQKVPPQWVGKDATFSTGCTKERAIAEEVQRRNPEMQIIGPDPEKFLRRSEYGIGLFHDTRLNEI
ncbi:MAG: ARMT1-like domain-containing protein [Pseudomonadota bacterium]